MRELLRRKRRRRRKRRTRYSWNAGLPEGNANSYGKDGDRGNPVLQLAFFSAYLVHALGKTAFFHKFSGFFFDLPSEKIDCGRNQQQRCIGDQYGFIWHLWIGFYVRCSTFSPTDKSLESRPVGNPAGNKFPIKRRIFAPFRRIVLSQVILIIQPEFFQRSPCHIVQVQFQPY